MAGFKTHITTSTLLGVGYGATAFTCFHAPLDQCLLATGLCGVSGMLPDIDSDSGTPLRESLAFAAAVVPMLLIDRFRAAGLSTDMIVLAGAITYLFVRFVLGYWLKRYTVHRGMFHSLPAAIIFSELAFLMSGSPELWPRLFKASAVFLGFMSHLLLDELYSIEFQRGRMRFKKSFGTAIKFFGQSAWGNVSAYVKLGLLTYVVVQEPVWQTPAGDLLHGFQHMASQTRSEQPTKTTDPTAKTTDATAKSWLEQLRQ